MFLTVDTSRPGLGSTSEILYLSAKGEWLKVVVWRVDVPQSESEGVDIRLAGMIVGLVAIWLFLNVVAFEFCRRRRRLPTR